MIKLPRSVECTSVRSKVENPLDLGGVRLRLKHGGMLCRQLWLAACKSAQHGCDVRVVCVMTQFAGKKSTVCGAVATW